MGRKRKYKKSYVISIRVSDEELDTMVGLMETLQIRHVSDLMRQAIQLVTNSSLVGRGDEPASMTANHCCEL
jgi:hypothetical protein